VRVYSTNKTDLASPKDSHALLGAEAVRAKWGVEPEQIGDVLALIGDSVDNIPGIPGFGPKTAVNLLKEFGSLDKLMANVDAVKSDKLRAKLQEARAQIAANREMVRLDCHLDLPLPIEEMLIRPRYAELIAALRNCEFKGLLAEVEAEAAAVAPVAAEPQAPPLLEAPAVDPAPAAPLRHSQGELF
jgi:DNA polymerase-1